MVRLQLWVTVVMHCQAFLAKELVPLNSTVVRTPKPKSHICAWVAVALLVLDSGVVDVHLRFLEVGEPGESQEIVLVNVPNMCRWKAWQPLPPPRQRQQASGIEIC